MEKILKIMIFLALAWVAVVVFLGVLGQTFSSLRVGDVMGAFWYGVGYLLVTLLFYGLYAVGKGLLK